MKLAIVGSRNFTNKKLFGETIIYILQVWGIPLEVISGGAKGADTLGEKWANENNIPTIIFYPDWEKHGKAAGPIRNKDIISAATHVLAFPSRTGRGTQHSIRLAQEQNKEIHIVWID